MNRTLLLLIMLVYTAFACAQNEVQSQGKNDNIGASKVIYSNAMTHCYVIAVAVNDSTVKYCISETSDRKIWRLTDRQETQSLGLFDKDTAIKIFESALKLANEGKVGDTIDIEQNINLKYIKVFGIKCIQLNNTLVGSSFNINKKTAKEALSAINNHGKQEPAGSKDSQEG